MFDNAKDVPNWFRYCTANLPMVIDNSLSMYEAICALADFVQTELVDVINTNAGISDELGKQVQALDAAFGELRIHVDEYFNNLDVQTEINEKLDQMVIDGVFDNILMNYANVAKVYNTATEALADKDNLVSNMKIKTLGYTDIYDHKGAFYLISDKRLDEKDVDLQNGLFAHVIDDGVLNINNYADNKHFHFEAKDVQGSSYSDEVTGINQQENENDSISLKWNQNILRDLQLFNKNKYPGKTAIEIQEPSQRNVIENVIINEGYDTGIHAPKSYYSIFKNIWSWAKNGMKFGPDNHEGWNGAANIESCHFNNANVGFLQNAKDSNTVTLDKCITEGSLVAVENYGNLNYINGYIGDQANHEDFATKDSTCFKIHDKTNTYVDKCYVYNDSSKQTSSYLVDMTDSTTSEVTLANSRLFIGNDNTENGNESGIYKSNNIGNTLYIDNCTFYNDAPNANHSQFPYNLENTATVKSHAPIKNYIFNGDFTDKLANEEILKNPAGGFTELSYKNPFGGKYFEHTFAGKQVGSLRMCYEVPEKFVGKKMCLEILAFSDSDNFMCDSPDLSFGAWYLGMSGWYNNRKNMPHVYRYEVTPTKTKGTLNFLINGHETDESKSIAIAYVCLKELNYKLNIGQYDCSYDLVIEKPTQPSYEGHIVRALNPATSKCAGWIYDTTWKPYGTIS